MILLPDEWANFVEDYKDGFIGRLTTFYDVVVPYSEWRRGLELRISIPNPQINMLAGTTPSNLMTYMPDKAWNQGFASRIVLVYSGKKEIKDDFDPSMKARSIPSDMSHDLERIFALRGEFKVSGEFQELMWNWRRAGESPKPTHPKLEHYVSRRKAHVCKLAMISSVDRDNSLSILGEDFHRALEWLIEAEQSMPTIFDQGHISSDARVMDELTDYVRRRGELSQTALMAEASKKVASYQVRSVVELLVHSGRLAFDSDRKIFTVIG